MLRFFATWLGAVFLFVAMAVPSSSETVRPAFWTVEENGKTLYLFGSVHLLPPEMEWMRAEIEAARKKSQVFVFEAPLNDADVVMGKFVEKHGKLPPGKTLRQVLSPKDFEAVESASWQVQYPPKLLATLRPWLAAVYLELYSYLNAGFSPYYGVDHRLEADAKKAGLALEYFETVEEQLGYFLLISQDTEVKYLRGVAQDILNKSDVPKQLVDAWAKGDVEGLDRLIQSGMADVPQLKAQILVARNRKWLPRIRDMLRSGKTYFVTVGAGHLVGKDGLVQSLRAQGLKITGP